MCDTALAFSLQNAGLACDVSLMFGLQNTGLVFGVHLAFSISGAGPALVNAGYAMLGETAVCFSFVAGLTPSGGNAGHRTSR